MLAWVLQLKATKKPNPQATSNNLTKTPIRGLVGVLRLEVCLVCSLKHNYVIESLEWWMCKCEWWNYEPKLYEMENTSNNGYGKSHVQRHSRMRIWNATKETKLMCKLHQHASEMGMQMHKQTRLIMQILSKNQLPRVSIQPRNHYESSTMKTQNSN